MKYPISLNDEDLKKIKEVGRRHLGIKNLLSIYGGIPAVIKFSVEYTLHSTNLIKKVIPNLPPKILDILLTTIKREKIDEYLAESKEERKKSLKGYNFNLKKFQKKPLKV